MSKVCKYFDQCLDKQKGYLCINNAVCRKCANNPYSKKSHYFEEIKTNEDPTKLEV